MNSSTPDDKWAPFWICIGVAVMSAIFDATGLSKREWIQGSTKIGKWIMIFAAGVIALRNLLLN
jgi:hypothetical protein